ncbi:urease subunit gamma [Streptomyces sp. OF3]|uniref:urease n=1 Tax=Streptomyces alkaliterrae TaxID=2213162 RepID=A0A7W3WGZ0_9ACTN|nr:urease subunit gamma [Streptomyces alkaliterrae]MBB1252141.1 urease subunit gamma [Streptomyces alkaliterrae]
MRLTPTERDRLLLFSAAELARARRARGLRLNIPEATALVADTVCEAARDGRRLAEAIEAACSVLGPDDVLPGVADVVTEVHVEAVFEDGSRLAVVPSPIRGAAALGDEAPGAVLPGPPSPEIEPALRLTVRNTAAVPVSVTSHFHFFEANPRLDFDRAAAYGMRLCVPAGSSVRFDPHGEAEVGLVPIGGDRIAIGFAGLVDGPLDAPGARAEALRRAAECGYLGAGPAADGQADGDDTEGDTDGDTHREDPDDAEGTTR